LWADVTDKPTTFAPSSHSHSWTEITSKPTTFAPSAHTHAISEVTGLQGALDGKAASSHTHIIGDVTGLQGALDGKSNNGHGHVISDITGLQGALDGKSATTHNHDGTYVNTSGDTMTGALTMGTNSIYGSSTGNYLSLNSSPTFSSVSSINIIADSDNSSTTEYVSIKAGTDELKVTSGAALTWNSNDIWHAGNFNPSTKISNNADSKASINLLTKSIGNDNKGLYLPYVDGGSYSTSTPTLTGAIKIVLPQSWTSTMMRFAVDIYEYQTGESFTVYIGGYNYSSGGGSWANSPSAYIVGANANRSFTVRFGHDGTKCCIYIGELNSTWSYPQITVKDFTAGYGSYEADKWNDGWDIGFEATAFGSVTATISDTLVKASYANTAGSATTATTATNSTQLGGVASGSYLRNDVAGTVSANLTVTGQLLLTKSGGGDNVRIGDDAWIGDINQANVVGIKGYQDGTKGFIRFGTDTNSFGWDGSKLAYGSNTIYHSGNFTPSNYVGTGNNQSIGTGFTVNGTMYVGSTSAGTNNGDLIIRGSGNSTIHLDGDSSGSINGTVKSYISGTGNATFAGAVTANSIAVTSTSMVNNLNAERLEGKKVWDFDTPISNADLGGYGVISGMQPRQGGATGPDASVKIEPGVVYTSSGRRFEFTSNYIATVPAAYQQYDRWDIYYVRGPVDGSNNPDPANEGTIQYAKGATDGLEPSIPTGSVPIVKIRVGMNDTGGVTVKDGTTGETPNLYDIRWWKAFRYDINTGFILNHGLIVANDISEKGSTLENKYARLWTDNTLSGNQKINGRVHVNASGTLGGTPTSGNYGLRVGTDSEYLAIDSNEILGVGLVNVRATNGLLSLSGTSGIVLESKVKAENNAKTVTIPAGQTSVIWTHNYGVTTYAVNLTSNSFERHVRWTSKAANTITIEIDTITTEDILVDCILIGY
jgi:hypothetical protein